MARVVFDPDGEARLSDAVDDALTRIAHEIADDMRRFVPVDTGALHEGIDVEDAHEGTARISSSRVVPGDDPHVPRYIEFGTRNMDAQPYMRPAVYQYRTR